MKGFKEESEANLIFSSKYRNMLKKFKKNSEVNFNFLFKFFNFKGFP